MKTIIGVFMVLLGLINMMYNMSLLLFGYQKNTTYVLVTTLPSVFLVAIGTLIVPVDYIDQVEKPKEVEK